MGEEVSINEFVWHAFGVDESYSEAWRYSGPFTRWNRFRRALPGFGIAVVAFSGYLVVEQLFLKDSQGHGEAQEEGHH